MMPCDKNDCQTDRWMEEISGENDSGGGDRIA